MADTPQTSSLIKLATVFRDDIIGQINRGVVLASMLSAIRGYNAAGPNWVASSDGHIAQPHAEGSAITDFGSDAQDTATLGWGLYEAPFHVTDEALSRAAASSNPNANRALWARNMIGAAEKLAHTIGAAVYTGTGANNIIGLATAIDDTTAYAGLDPATKTFWKALESDPGTETVLTKAQIRADLAAIKKASNHRPDLAMVDPGLFARMLDLYDVQREFITVTSVGSADATLGDAKLASVYVDGCRFVEDVQCPAKTIYYISSSQIRFEFLPYVEVPGFTTFNTSNPALPFAMDVVPLAKVGHASRAALRCQVQLVLERRNAFGVRKNVSELAVIPD